MITFRDFSFDENYRYLNFLKMCIQIPSILSPQALFSYKEQFQFQRGYAADLCWHKGIVDGAEYWIAPVGDWDEINWGKVFLENVPAGTVFIYVPEYLANLWQRQLGAAVELEEDRDNWDYILYLDKMEKLKGQDLNSVRLGRDSFEKNYSYEIEEITPKIFDELREFQAYVEEIDDAADDSKSFNFALEHWDDFKDLFGFVVRVEGKIVAYALNEQIDETYSIELFSRSNYKYKGVNQFVYWYDAKMNLERGILTQNIMADIGEENLRFFKENLSPLVMLKKFIVKYNPEGKEIVPKVETYEEYDLKVSFERLPKVVTVYLHGKLNTEAATWAEKNILAALEGADNAIFDLKELEYISSSGLRILVAAMKKMKAQGGKMTLKNVGEQVREVLEMTGFSQIFNLSKA